VLRTRWDAGSRVDLVARAAEPGRRELYINGGSQANLWPWRGALADAAPLGTKLEALPFQIGPAGRVLDLGAGGGYDALVALACGAERVVCVEMNRTVVELALEAEGTSGALFRDPRVELRVEEARSFLARDGSRYDVIFSALTSTLACADVRESTFLESTVYTVEALGTLLDRLAPGGRLALVINREDLVDRLALTLLAAWERRGIAPAEAMRRVLVLRDPRPAAGTWTELLVAAREPLPAVATDLARLRGFEVRWAPGGTGSSEPLARVAAGELTPAGMAALSRSRIDPATDDRPHFFRSERGPDRRLTTLLLELAPVLAVALALLLRAGRGARSGAGASLAWFAITGAGFLMIEVTLLSLFGRVLGLPALTLAVVLAGLLTWSGLGSLAAGALRSVEPARLGGWAGLAVAALGLGFAAGLPPLLDRMLALPLPARAAASFACLAPIGFALGIPFPMGLRAAGRARPGLVPWLWGWNGLLSVAGSVLGVMLALELGLRLTLAVSAALYALLPLLTRRLAGSHASGAGVAEYGGRGE
jgi:SAM-dependent methyltransferase